MMKHAMVFAGVLLSFGAGFLAGRYSDPDRGIGRSLSAAGPTTAIFPGTVASEDKPAGPSPNKTAPPSRGIPSVPHSSRAAQGNRSAIASEAKVRPLPELVLTPQEQADLAAQQWEVRDASLKQVEAMIQSLEAGNAPQEQIAHFRELKKAMEEQAIDEIHASETNAPERSEVDLKNELAASLAQSGIPRAEREQMLEAQAASGLTDDSADIRDLEIDPH